MNGNDTKQIQSTKFPVTSFKYIPAQISYISFQIHDFLFDLTKP